MLTKSMLQYRLNGGRVKPALLEFDDADENTRSALAGMERALQGATGRPLQVVLNEIEAAADTLRKTGTGLAKIAADLLEAAATVDNTEDFRWQVFARSQQLRVAVGSVQELQKSLYEEFPDWKSKLFADLETRRAVTGVKAVKTSLADRFNLAQIQGLLVQAQSVRCTIKQISAVELRALIRAAKFFQVLLEIERWREKECSFALTGPLSIFQNRQAYGLRIASFFPLIVTFAEWQVEAEINLKGRSRRLVVDHKTGLRSHYRPIAGYIPEELQQIEAQLLLNLPGWRKVDDPEVINLGDDHLVVPDINIENQNKKRIHIEFFHKWHKGQFIKRLDFLMKRSSFRFVLVVPRELLKEAEQSGLDATRCEKSTRVVEFAKTPSAKRILEAVNLVSAEGS